MKGRACTARLWQAQDNFQSQLERVHLSSHSPEAQYTYVRLASTAPSNRRLRTGKYMTDRLAVEERRNMQKSKPETLNRASIPRIVHPLHSGHGGTPMTGEDGVSWITSRHYHATESMNDVLMNVGSQFSKSSPFTGMCTA